MGGAVARYLARHGVHQRWPLQGDAPGDARMAIVIPALAEHPNLLQTLDDLAANDAAEQAWVVVVVNQREDAGAAIAENNRQTFDALQQLTNTPFRLAWVDAAAPGNELPPKEGVGLARRIGLDHAAAAFSARDKNTLPLMCLDADTRVPPGYCAAVLRHFRTPRWGVVVDYHHAPAEDAQAQEAIDAYELFLRCHELGLRLAGSPYAFQTVGSAMGATVEAYAASGGMPKRLAAEDFYFLQQLAKTGAVSSIDDVTLRPSPRISERVPFGTGRAMADALAGTRDPGLAYHPEAYDVLRRWLGAVAATPDAPPETLLGQAATIHAELARFLEQERFSQRFAAIQRSAGNAEQALAQFHRWFDALKTVRLLHHLRDSTWPSIPAPVAAHALLDAAGLPAAPAAASAHEALAAMRAKNGDSCS